MLQVFGYGRHLRRSPDAVIRVHPFSWTRSGAAKHHEPARMSEQNPPASQASWLIQMATVLAGVSLVLVIVNIALALVDQTAQAEATQRQQQIAQAAQLEALTNVLTHALSTQEQSSKDPQLQALLTRAAAGAPPPPPTAAAKP
jgi:succinate dehydrogenase hydrophobic anchor subunit